MGVFDIYLEENKEQREFLEGAENCKTKEDREAFCKKYLNSKGHIIMSIKEVDKNKRKEKAEIDWFDNLMDVPTNPPEPLHQRPTPRNMYYVQGNYTIPNYQLHGLDVNTQANYIHHARKEAVNIISKELLNGEFIKFDISDDMYLDAKRIKATVGVIKP